MNSDLVSYYRDRAKEYERIYDKPERQKDLQHATQMLQEIFRGKQVLEIACGTGYWTERIAQTAKMIFATDINDAVLEIARAKTYAPAIVSFGNADIFRFPAEAEYESLFGGFIWSHIPLQDLDGFVTNINSQVVKGGTVVFMDNIYVAGSNHQITDTDGFGNTYQTRKLTDGTLHKVLKNFPSVPFMHTILNGKATDINLISLDYFWLLQYRTAY